MHNNPTILLSHQQCTRVCFSTSSPGLVTFCPCFVFMAAICTAVRPPTLFKINEESSCMPPACPQPVGDFRETILGNGLYVEVKGFLGVTLENSLNQFGKQQLGRDTPKLPLLPNLKRNILKINIIIIFKLRIGLLSLVTDRPTQRLRLAGESPKDRVQRMRTGGTLAGLSAPGNLPLRGAVQQERGKLPGVYLHRMHQDAPLQHKQE